MLTRAAVGMSRFFWYSNQKLRRKRDSRAHTPLLRNHRYGHQAFGTGDVPAQDGVRDAQHQHAIGAAKGDFVVPRAVAEREVAGAEARPRGRPGG